MHFIDEADQRLAEQFLLGVAQEMLRGFVAALDEAVGRGDQDRVAQAVEHGIQVVLGNGGFVQLLPHALERELQIAEFVVALHGERPGVIALADSIGALHQRGYRGRQPAGDEPGSEQTAQNQQRQRESGEHAADPLGLNALFAEQLRADVGQRLLHFGAAHPNPESAAALHVALHDERIRALGRAAGLLPEYKTLLCASKTSTRSMSRSSSNLPAMVATAALLPCAQRRGQRGAGGVAQGIGARLQVSFQFLLDRDIGQLVGIGCVEAALVVCKGGQNQQQHGADTYGKEQIVGFKAARHLYDPRSKQ